jgi:hypothetical protein
MGVLTNVTGSAWATSGAATPGTTGLNSVTGLTHAAHDLPIPLGCTAAGKLRGADDASIGFRVGASSESFVNLGDTYLNRFYLAARRTATTLAADATTCNWMAFSNSGTKLRADWRLRNNANAPGLMVEYTNYTGSGTRTALSATLGGSVAGAGFCFDAWQEIALEVSRNTAGAVARLYHQGVMVVELSGLDTETAINQTNLRGGFTFTLPAIAGIRWELTGDMTTWDAPASDLIVPRWDMDPATSHIAQYHIAAWTNRPNGGLWDSSGTAAVTPTSYATSGANPFRKRFVVSGSATQTALITTRQKLGAPAYNSSGICTVLFPMVYVPNGSASLEVLTTGGASLIRLDIDSSTIKQGATTLSAWTATSRYAVMIHLSSSGTATYSICDVTIATDAGTKWASGDLLAWTPQNLGLVNLSSVLGATSQEIDGVALCRWVDVAGVDSLSQTATTGLTPNYSTRNHVVANLSHGVDTMTMPGGNYVGRPFGVEHWCFLVIAGSSGKNRASFRSSVTAPMTKARGVAVLTVDGGSINDVAPATTQPLADSALAAFQSLLRQQCDDLVPNGNRTWLASMSRRETTLYGGLGSIQNVLIDSISSAVNAIALEKQAQSRITLSNWGPLVPDHRTLFTFGTDETHFNAAGSTTVAEKMFSSYSVASAPTNGGLGSPESRLNSGLTPFRRLGVVTTAAGLRTYK